ncbi:GNAT family N-acetyltransferase [Natronolimnobius sp. AArcel1]|uniref:GNAT family N-acetyltransferase n=1 Tax=Natronolimnobius sp. AArcel1 TaxID=1679093 RepID=UPI0013EC49B3|nr:GNAT family N-acetyltransferase [Natronolimnobius sp. AArcel1]NGM70929.1 GNAT family N-acetyltransferase [Natronolimnobius sp. AArcel1]
MADYRQIPDEREVFHEYRTYAFAPELGPTSYDSDEHDTPRALLGSPRGIYPDANADASQPRAVCRHYWLNARVRGEFHPTAGLAAVAAPPEYRRQGSVGRLLEHSLEEYRERGCQFAVLWPFQYAFYRQFGWDTSNTIVTHECDPETLAFASDEADRDGSFMRLEPNDYDRLESAYHAFAEEYALSLERSADWWRYCILESFDTDPYIYAYERDGVVRGYLTYTIEATADHSERTMDVSELAFETYDDLLALLSFCHTHDSQVDRIRLRLPEQVPLLEIAAEPDKIETTVETGPMVRLVDVEAALSALLYPDLEATITLAVTDDVAEWNDATFTLSSDDGGGVCDRDDSLTADAADAQLDIGALSQLAVGARSATALERTGRLEADTSTLETVTALFPETATYLSDQF